MSNDESFLAVHSFGSGHFVKAQIVIVGLQNHRAPKSIYAIGLDLSLKETTNKGPWGSEGGRNFRFFKSESAFAGGRLSQFKLP